jgi:hypothetical protein
MMKPLRRHRRRIQAMRRIISALFTGISTMAGAWAQAQDVRPLELAADAGRHIVVRATRSGAFRNSQGSYVAGNLATERRADPQSRRIYPGQVVVWTAAARSPSLSSAR